MFGGSGNFKANWLSKAGKGVTALIAYFLTKLFLFPEKYQNSSIRKPQSSWSSAYFKSKEKFLCHIEEM